MEENDNPKWPFELFGVECGEGWYPLIKPIFEYIEEYNKDKEKEEDKMKVLQCKEKFAGLRVYLNFYDEKVRKLIHEASEKSYETCEMCGKPGKVQVEGHWWYAMCDQCFNKMLDDRKKRQEEFLKMIEEKKKENGH